MIAYKLANEIWWKRYISSYYFVCVSMNTVGYGDFVPQNEIERVFCIFFIYVACGIFAYTLNIVGQIIQQISKNKSLFLHNMMTINEYMNKRNINFDLRTKIRKYLEYVWMEEQSQNSEDENLIINKLSISLKEDLFLQTNGNIIKEIPFFMNNFSEKTLKKLAFTLKELHYMPGDIIFQKGDNLDQSFYILWKGEVELYMDLFQKKQTNQSIEKIKMGNSFGEKEFITGCERAISARSTSFSTVFILKYSDFMDILLESPEDFIKFKEIKDKIDLYNNYVDMPIICDHCKEANHSITECPLLHLIILRKRIIQKFCYQKPNERISMHKRKGQKYNARRKMQVYQFVAKTIQKENFFDEDVSENHENSENSSSARILEEMQKNKNEVVNASESEDLEESSENYFYDAEKFNLNQNEKKDIICSNNSNFQIELPGIIEKNKITSLVSDSYKYLYIKKPSEEAIKSSNDMTIKKKIIVNNSEIKNSNSIAKIHTSNSNEISKYAVINEDEKKKNFDLFKIFERKMDYENYFPLGNSENIIKLYNKFSENIFNLSPMSRKMKKYPTRKRIYDQNFSKLLTPNNLNSSKKLIPSFSKSFFFNKDEVRKNKDKIPSMLDRQSMIKLLKRTKKREKKSFFARIIVFVKKMLEEN